MDDFLAPVRFEQPPDPKVRIWRYINLLRLLEILRTGTIALVRADLLGDPFEGALPRRVWQKLESQKHASELAEMLGEVSAVTRQDYRRAMYISCWHANEHESAAMWYRYAKHPDSVAIVSRFDLLNAAKPPFAEAGVLRYIDYEQDDVEVDGIFWPFIHKRISFGHEKEVRVILYEPSHVENARAPKIIPFPINPLEFIQEIVASPFGDERDLQTLRDTIARFEIDPSIVRMSKLKADEPNY